MKTPDGSLWSRILRSVFGNIQWTPPAWLSRLAGSVGRGLQRHPRSIFITLLILAAAVWGGWEWKLGRDAREAERLAWEAAHRARPDKVDIKLVYPSIRVQPPGPPALRGDRTYADQLLVLEFSAVVAPLAAILPAQGRIVPLPSNILRPPGAMAWQKEPSPGLSLEPAHPGNWVWDSEQHLAFRPSVPWPADKEFKVTIADSFVFRPEVILPERSYKFKTAPFTASVGKVEFYTDPTNPNLQQVVAEMSFSHPVPSPLEVERHLAFTVVGGSPIYNGADGKAPASLFTLVTDDKDPLRHFWARSVPVTIPVKEDFALVTVTPGMAITAGGKAMEKEASGRVRVPDISSGLAIGEVQTQLVHNDEGESAQILLLNTSGYASLGDVTARLEMKVLPPKEGDDPVWKSAEEVPDDIAAKATPVKFTAEPNEEKFTRAHAFRLEATAPGQLLVTVKKGLPGAGGFILPADFRSLAAIPEFPRELSFTARGGLLALNGERKIAVKARRVSHIRYTLARVKESQLNHLVSMSRGSFSAPEFRGSFSSENITRIRTEVVKLEKTSDYKAVFSAFDFTPATSAPAAADSDRGLFFLSAEAVRPRPKNERGEPDFTEDAEESQRNGQSQDPEWIIESSTVAPNDVDEEGRNYEYGPRRFVLVTDLGLLVKQNADASRDIFVQSVSKGGPVAGVELSVLAKNGDTVAQAQTDAEGHARFDSVAHLLRDLAPVAIVARLGKDLAFMPWQRQDRTLDLSRFDTGGVLGSETQALDAFLFTERGIFRPGDKVHFGISVRPRGWEAKVEGVPVTLEIRTPAGQICSTVDLKLPADGFLEADATLNENDPTGQYSARLMLGEEGMQLGRVHFRVEDFQPDTMKLVVALPGEPAAGWRTSPDIKATVDVKTLFGFAAAGRRVTGKVVVSRAQFSFPGFPDYSFHRYLPENFRWPSNNEWSLGELKTEEDGGGTFDLGLEKLAGASVAFTFYAEAFEADGGRSVAGSQSGMYSPLTEVVGYKADGDLNYIGQDAPRSLQLVCVGPDGKAKAAPALTAQVIETRYHSVLTRQESGSYAYTSTRRETVVSENPLAIPAEGLAFALPVNKTGNFQLKLLAEDKTVRLAVAFSIAGKGESGRSLEQNAELEMKLSRNEWKSGEEIECSLSAPFTGSGLLTIEREKVLAWQWFRSGATDSVQKIKVPDSVEGSAYVSASFVRALDSPEVFMSPLSYAVVPFRANVDKRRNDIKLDCPPVVVPGSPLKIGFRSATPQRAVVYAVDEGIHQITNYKLPEPLDFFLRKRALEVQTFQILDLILPEFTILGRSRAFGGGDGGDEDEVNMTLNPFKRRREAPVVYWSGIIETGPERREVEYAVPDYFAGQLTIMAVAAGGGSMGSAQTKTLVRGPFVLSPNTPLFAAPGDTFTASLTIANNTEGIATGADQVRASLQVTDNLEVVASPDVTAIPVGKEGTVRFQVKTREPLGNATLTFRTEAGGISSTRAVTLSIRPASPRMTSLQSGWFRTPEHQVKTERSMHGEFAERRTSVSSLPLNLAAGLEKWLHEFPHGCTEQIVSRAMARTILSDDAAFGFDRATAWKEMESVFTTLRSRQMPDGEFGLWGRSRDGGIEFLTPYVTHFLTEAKEAGFPVPPALLQNALKRLRVQAALTSNNYHEHALVARTIYLLTRNGEVTTNYLLNLRDILEKNEKETWQSSDAAPWMACTYAMLKQEDEARKLITAWREAKRKAVPVTTWDYYYEQALSREATALMLLSRHFPDIAGNLNYEDLKPITRGIEKSEFNTYSAAGCVMALKAWSALHKQSNIFTSLHELTKDAEPRLLGPVGSGLVAADFTAAATGIQFGIIRPEGAPDMGAYWQIVESGYDRALPTEPVREGLEVMRAFMNGDKETTDLKVGEGVDIRIGLRNLTTKAQRDIALVDLLPCGFELEAGSLTPGPNGAQGADSVDVREDRNIFYCSVAPQHTLYFHYRVKPVCAGTFTVPPASASSMYDHAIHARGLPSTITVKSRE